MYCFDMAVTSLIAYISCHPHNYLEIIIFCEVHFVVNGWCSLCLNASELYWMSNVGLK